MHDQIKTGRTRSKENPDLRINEHIYEPLMKLIGDGVYLLNNEGRFLFVNDIILKKTGWPRKWFLKRTYLDVIHPRDRKRLRKYFNKIMREEKVPIFSVAYRTASGRILFMEINTTPIFDGQHVVGLVGISRDITARKKYEQKLKMYRDQLEKMVEERTAKLQKYGEELNNQKKELEKKNVALQELLDQIEIRKDRINNDIATNIDKLIMPTVNKLKTNGVCSDTKCLEILKKNLYELTSQFGRKLSSPKLNLTPREIEVCNLAKNGLSSKEIAELLRISLKTVHGHRDKIRRKLDISNKKINLVTYLQNL